MRFVGSEKREKEVPRQSDKVLGDCFILIYSSTLAIHESVEVYTGC